MAVCRVVGGECTVECVDVPEEILRLISRVSRVQPLPVLDWVLGTIADSEEIGRFGSPHFFRNLHRGIYRDANSGEVVRFTLPGAIEGMRYRISEKRR
jgi:hypothetical protein